MDDKENRITTGRRASKKRLNESVEGISMSKKRVVLGELTNTSSNATGLTIKSGSGKSRKPIFVPEPQEKVGELVDETVNTSIDVNVDFHVIPETDESQKIGLAHIMYRHLHSLEVEAKRRPSCNYMEKVQKDITPAMREILVDWLVEVAEEFKLLSDTLYLTINYIDKYLSAHDLRRNKLQLLGVSCMLVAATIFSSTWFEAFVKAGCSHQIDLHAENSDLQAPGGAEGTMGQLAAGSNIDCQVRCQPNSSHVVQRHQ
ncbi:unnamed protein product [Fraxinus pennsylvanica]|uniref:Cyclin-like domain-containing protein n=1 Tax=Fraxinus pennsylvanica TaxID=56036 RepID=A0AAD1ZMJ7_9LAMI|nr:unnamed protein product [Fraxinus pennsylvanica]